MDFIYSTFSLLSELGSISDLYLTLPVGEPVNQQFLVFSLATKTNMQVHENKDKIMFCWVELRSQEEIKLHFAIFGF